MTENKKIAVLIDGDNAQYTKIKAILNEIAAHGHIVVKRAYGDWSSDYLKNWKNALNELAIQPIQQFAYTTGKNSTDASMIIDAMDLLYSSKIDTFVLVSSDSDFTKLASRLRESEKFVFGVGEKKTPISFRNACDDFVLTENLDIEQTQNKTGTPELSASQQADLVPLLRQAWEISQDESGWVSTAAAGPFLKRQMPDFDPRTYGAKKLSDLIQKLHAFFEMNIYQGKGTVMIHAFRPLS